MIFPLLLSLALHAPQSATMHGCTPNGVEAHTASITSSKGQTITLAAHSEDDHSKNTHLCLSEYKFTVTPATGSPRESGWDGGVEDAWGRPITFTLSGLSQDGSRAFGFVVEGTADPVIEVLSYDLHSGAFEPLAVDNATFRSLSPACRSTLGVVGTTSRSTPVIGTAAAAGCTQARAWQVLPTTRANGSNMVRTLPRGAKILPLAVSAAR